ncbi:hypothetical protein GQ457_11G014860 [Hibiscus cannabinus]
MSAIMHKIGETLHMGGDDKKREKQKGEGYYNAGADQGQAYTDGSVENKREGYYDSGSGQDQAYAYGSAENKREGYYDAGAGQDQAYAYGRAEGYYDAGAGQGETYAYGRANPKGEGYYDDGVGQGQDYIYGSAENKGEGCYDAGQGQSYGTEYKGETGDGYGSGMTGATYMGEGGQGKHHKEGLMDEIKDKIRGGHESEKKKKHEDDFENNGSDILGACMACRNICIFICFHGVEKENKMYTCIISVLCDVFWHASE